MRELFKALSELETRLMEQYGVSLNCLLYTSPSPRD